MSFSLPSSWKSTWSRLREESPFLWRAFLASVFTYAVIDFFFPEKPDLTGTLTALLVVQSSVFKTIQSFFDRVIAVISGVTIAILISKFFGMNIVTLGVSILIALYLGVFLKLGDNKLEVPISAMLVLNASQHGVASEQRIINTFIGAGIGVVFVLLWPMKPKLESALSAVGDIASKTADQGVKAAVVIEESAESLDIVTEVSPIFNEIVPEVSAARDEVEEVRKNYLLTYTLDKKIKNHKIDLMSAITSLESSISILQQIVLTLEVESEVVNSDLSIELQKDLRLIYSSVIKAASEAVRSFGEMLEFGVTDDVSSYEENLLKTLEKLRGASAMLVELSTVPELPEVTSVFVVAVLKNIDELVRELEFENLNEFQVSTVKVFKSKIDEFTVLNREVLKKTVRRTRLSSVLSSSASKDFGRVIRLGKTVRRLSSFFRRK